MKNTQMDTLLQMVRDGRFEDAKEFVRLYDDLQEMREQKQSMTNEMDAMISNTEAKLDELATIKQLCMDVQGYFTLVEIDDDNPFGTPLQTDDDNPFGNPFGTPLQTDDDNPFGNPFGTPLQTDNPFGCLFGTDEIESESEEIANPLMEQLEELEEQAKALDKEPDFLPNTPEKVKQKLRKKREKAITELGLKIESMKIEEEEPGENPFGNPFDEKVVSE